MAMLIAMDIIGLGALAKTISERCKLPSVAELKKEIVGAKGVVQGMRGWYDNHKIDTRHKNGLGWLFNNPKAYAKYPIAIILNLKNGNKKHAVVVFNGLCYDPNNKFTVPFDRKHLGDEYTNVTEGYRFSITEKALKRKRG
jgi:hypothetical protein